MIVTRGSLLKLLALPVAAQSADRISGKNVAIAQTNYKGRRAIQVIAKPETANATSYALVKDVSFRDGVIEVDLAASLPLVPLPPLADLLESRFGSRATDATSTSISDPPTAGPTIKSGGTTPLNIVRTRILTSPDRGRRLLKSYESYVDLQPGVWTKYKIEVEGRKARLYVHGADQPCLIVNDLKLEPREGGVALWVGPGTEGYFFNLKVAAR